MVHSVRIQLWNFLKSMRVEPLMLLIYFNSGLSSVGITVGKYRAICQQVLGPDKEYFDCMNPASRSQTGGNYSSAYSDFATQAHNAEVMVQQANVFWNMMFTISYSITAFFGDTILAALGDRYGRKNNILIGIVGTLVSVFPYLVLFTFASTPLYIFLIANAIAGLTGYQSIISISFFAYLADTVVDHSNLTVRMTFLYSFSFISSFVTPPISAYLLGVMSYASVELISECALILAFFLSLAILKQTPPKLMRKIAVDRYVLENGCPPPGTDANPSQTSSDHKDCDTKQEYVPGVVLQNRIASNMQEFPEQQDLDERRKPDTESTTRFSNQPGEPVIPSTKSNSVVSIFRDIRSIVTEFWILMKEIYHTYRKPRPGRNRAYLLIITSVYFFHVMFEMGTRRNILYPFVQKSPFFWGPNELALFKSFAAGVKLVGTTVGIWLLKKIFKFRDTTIIILTMATHVIEMTIMAFAKISAEIFMANGINFLWGVIIPCVKSITTQLVDADEVGKSYILFGLSTTVGTLISSVAYDNIYIATVGYFPGFVFLLAGILETICIAALIWLHFDQKKSHKTLVTIRELRSAEGALWR